MKLIPYLGIDLTTATHRPHETPPRIRIIAWCVALHRENGPTTTAARARMQGLFGSV